MPKHQQLDVLRAAIPRQLVNICRICRRIWYASEGFMIRIVTAKGQRQADNVARLRLEPGLRAAQARSEAPMGFRHPQARPAPGLSN